MQNNETIVGITQISNKQWRQNNGHQQTIW